MRQTFYYEGKEGEDFFPTVKKIKPLPDNYKYITRHPLLKLFSFLLYYFIAEPIVLFYCKFVLHQKFVGKNKLKKIKGGYFIYSNHTLAAGDAFISNILNLTRKNYITVGKEASSLTSILPLLRALGAIPLNQTYTQAKEMIDSMGIMMKRSTITIFPEAHIWPYYNKVRDYPSTSLKYPYKFKVPVVTITNCFTKKRFSDKPKVTTFINGPYYFDYSLPKEEAIKQVYNLMLKEMKETADKYSTYSYHNYIKVEPKP